jgi:flagellar P-ring protein precursor FlgI
MGGFSRSGAAGGRLLLVLLLALGAVAAGSLAAQGGEVRVKDVASIRGVRENELLGYGLVIGLNGTGDKSGTLFTAQSVASMLQRLGVQVPRDRVSVRNVAAVAVTAKLPAFAKAGTSLDVTVSSLGDATSLQGGTLIRTPLLGADGRVYAVAHGAVSIGGFNVEAGGTGEKLQKNHPTVGRIPGGALVEREVPMTLVENQSLAVVLHSPDFTTARRLADAINAALEGAPARAEDAATVRVQIRPGQDVVSLVADLEVLRVRPDRVARVVINERTGTVILGSEVRVSTVAVSHANLTLQIKAGFQVSQPPPLSEGRTAIVPKSEISAHEERRPLVVVEEGTSIGDIVQALNALGVTSRDLIAILQAIKQAGALQGELEIL